MESPLRFQSRSLPSPCPPSRGGVIVAVLVVVSALILRTATARAQGRTLMLPDGTRVGTLTSASPPSSWRPEGSDRRVFATGLWRAVPPEQPRVVGGDRELRLALGEPVALPPAPTASAVVTNGLVLETTMGEPFVEIGCAEVQVLRAEPRNGRWFVRAHRRGYVLEGFVRSAPRQVEWGVCGARVSGEANYPAHFLAVDPGAASRVRLEGSVFWREHGRCARWTFTRHAHGPRLERTVRFALQGGIVERNEFYPFFEEHGVLMMSDVGGEQHWVRPPSGALGIGLGGVGAGPGVYAVGFVREDRDAIVWLAGGVSGVTAYHPADAVVWYRSRAACMRERSNDTRHR